MPCDDCPDHRRIDAAVAQHDARLTVTEANVARLLATQDDVARLMRGNGRPPLDIRITTMERILDEWRAENAARANASLRARYALAVGLALNAAGWVGTLALLWFSR